MTAEVFDILTFLLSLVAIPLFNYYLGTFLEKGKWFFYQVFACIGYIIWHFQEKSLVVNLAVNILLVFLVSIIGYQGKAFVKLIFSALFYTTWMIIEVFFEMVFSEIEVPELFYQFRLLGTVASLALFAIVIMAIRRLYCRFKYTYELPLCDKMLIFLIPIGSLIVVDSLFRITLGHLTQRGVILWATMSVCIILTLNIGVFSYYIRLAERFELKKSNELYEQHIGYMEARYKEHSELLEALRNLKHDTKHELLSIRTYAKNKEFSRIVDIVDVYLSFDKVHTDKSIQSGNLVMDEVINYWKGICDLYKIDFSFNLKVPYNMSMDGRDMIHILGNAIENAIEATKPLPIEERKISLLITYSRAIMKIIISNSYDGIIIKNSNGEILTKKKNKSDHGRGLNAILCYVEKYDGTVEVSTTDKVFTLKILLYKKSIE